MVRRPSLRRPKPSRAPSPPAPRSRAGPRSGRSQTRKRRPADPARTGHVSQAVGLTRSNVLLVGRGAFDDPVFSSVIGTLERVGVVLEGAAGLFPFRIELVDRDTHAPVGLLASRRVSTNVGVDHD